MTLKFAFVVGALVVALMSYFICNSRRDWAWLVGGLAFTVGADFFLVLYDWHLPGVAIFCFAHVCYISRALDFKGNEKEKGNKKRRGAWKLFLAVGLAVLITSYLGVIWVAGLYAGLFIANLTINFMVCKRRGFGDSAPIAPIAPIKRKTCLPKCNRALILTGLVLFSLCDVNVLLFNLPQHTNIYMSAWLIQTVFYLIWVFYLPAQAILAISAVSFREYNSRL